MLYPKIGIRPVIDGRWGGIRESLEDQTMGLAAAAKELIETREFDSKEEAQSPGSQAGLYFFVKFLKYIIA